MTVQFDASKFYRFTEELVRRIPASRRDVIRAETGAVLKAWLLKTKVAKPRTLEYRGRKDAVRAARRLTYGGSGKASELRPGQAWFTAGKSTTPFGRVWIWNKFARSFFLLQGPGAPKGDQINKSGTGKSAFLFWNTRALLLPKIKAAQASAGLSRQSIVQIGDALGIRIESVPGGRNASAAVAKARRAMASDGIAYRNGTGSEAESEHKFFTKLVNNLPWARSPRIQMDTTLALVLKGRMNYFRRNVAAGVFQDAAKIARAYPGIRVNAPTKAES
jgi:hypothetical protein